VRGYEARKNELLAQLSGLQHRLITFQYEQHLADVSQLKADIEEDRIVMVTLGEFNNGKSTFVNALIGEELVPMGITPTTATINMLVYGEERELLVHKHDGTVERLPLQEGTLEPFTAEGTEGNDGDIRFLQLQLPSPVLKQSVVLVDTPGVNDLNTIRSSITYSLIPRADIVLFILNMTSPVKRTEFDFLTNVLLKHGLDRILFIANYADAVNASEEEMVQIIRSRLAAVEGLTEFEVLPLSAREALEGKRRQDRELIELSGIEVVEKKIKELVEYGSRAEEKLARYRLRASRLFTGLEGEIERHLVLCRQSEEEMEQGLASLKDWDEQLPKIEEQMEAYMSDRNTEINLMLDKSVDYLFENVTREIEESITVFNGTDIGHYFQTSIPLLIKRRLKTWIDHNADKIDDLLGKLEVEISKGLSEAFEESIEVKRVQSGSLDYDERPHMQSPELEDPMVKSGLLVGGAGALAMIFGAPIFIPIIAMAGLPYVQKKMLKNQLERVKPKLIMEVNNHLSDIKGNFSEWVESYVTRSMRAIKRESIEQIKKKSRAHASVLERESDVKKQGIDHQRDLQKELQQFLAEVSEQRQQILREEGR
jgi:GTPase SAR1 family protein